MVAAMVAVMVAAMVAIVIDHTYSRNYPHMKATDEYNGFMSTKTQLWGESMIFLISIGRFSIYALRRDQIFVVHCVTVLYK